MPRVRENANVNLHFWARGTQRRLLGAIITIGRRLPTRWTKRTGGVVHRDLKPGNIMLTPTGAKLLDFGLAKPLAPVTSVDTWTAAVRQSSPITEQGAIVGTFQYMSPEQIEGKELDGRSDIFSLGAVLYEMLTGQRAFEGKSQLSVASAVLEKEPAPISSIKPLTPLSLEHTVRRCLAKNPDERWQTARDLALELQWIAESGSQAGAPTTAARPGRNGDLFGWAASTLLLCALAALGIAYWKRTVPTSTVVRSAIPPPPDSQFYAMNIDAGGPAISPDGKFVVAAVKDSKGKTLLWLHAFEDAGEGKALPGTDDGATPSGLRVVARLFFTLEGNSSGSVSKEILCRRFVTRHEAEAERGVPRAPFCSPRHRPPVYSKYRRTVGRRSK
jgi:hypothetical protein